MQLTCRRCLGSFSVPGPGTAPCPACGSIDVVAARSPKAATTERPAGAFSAPVSQPVAAPVPPHSAMAPYGQAPHAPSYPAPPPGHAPQTLGPYAQPSVPMAPLLPQHVATQHAPPQPYVVPYAQPVHVVIQNQYQGAPVAPVPYAMVPYARRKDAGVAALLSFFLPGAGQLYNGQTGKGLAFLLVTLFVNLPLALVGIGFVTGLVTWIWAMIDAHGSAEKINRGEIVV